jgi:VanZ family protein
MPRSQPPLRDSPPRFTVRPPARPWRRLLADYGPALLMMVVIFVASMDAGSGEHSGRIIGLVLDWLGLTGRLSPRQVDLLRHYVRKLAHLTEYALLAVLLHRAVARERRRWTIRIVAGVIAVGALYAASDEFHQQFVATRGPSAADVLLDTVGATVGLGLKWLGERRWSRRSSG